MEQTSYKFESKHLGQAFMNELEDIGYEKCAYYEAHNFNQIKDHFGDNPVKFIDFGGTPCDKEFQLPDQWNEALEHAKEQLQPEFEVGDWVLYKSWNVPKRIATIRSSDGWFGFEGDYLSNNRYNHWRPTQFRHATPEEIEQATKQFFGYDTKVSETEIKIGCRRFDRDRFENLIENLHELDNDITIGELIDELETIGVDTGNDLPF